MYVCTSDITITASLSRCSSGGSSGDASHKARLLRVCSSNAMYVPYIISINPTDSGAVESGS